MNRFSRISTSQFDPMSMQEVFSVPLAKQAQHDQLMSQADELGLFNVQSLEKDTDLVNDYKNQFSSSLDNITNEVMSSGINNVSKQKLKSLAADRNKWLNEGQGKDVSSNYAAYVANKEELDKMYQNGKISRDKYQLGLRQALGNYEGVAKGGQYQSFSAVHDTDFLEKADKIGKAMQGNPQKIASFSGLQYDPRTGKYLDVKTNIEKTEAGAIKQAVMASLMMDMDVMSDINQRQQLGMLGDVSAGSYIEGLGILNEEMYKVNNFDQSKQYTGIDQGQLDSRASIMSDSKNYELSSNETLDITNNDLYESLKTISDGGDTNFSGAPKYATNPDGTDKRDQYGNLVRISEGEKASYKNMDGKIKSQYDIIYNKMKKQGTLKGGPGDPESIKAVKNLLESSRGLTSKQIKYTSGITKTYEGRNSKFKRSTPQELGDGIANNPEERVFIDTETRKEIKYKDLPNDVQEQIMNRTARVTSVYSSRNFLNKEYGNILQPDVTAAMLELQTGNNKKYLVSRSASERRTPAYQADVKMNEVWSDINSVPPTLENEFNIQGNNVKLTKQLDNTISVEVNGKKYNNLQGDDPLEMFIKAFYNVE